MIIKHETNTTLGTMQIQDISVAFEQVMDIINGCIGYLDVLKDYQDGMLDADDVLDQLELVIFDKDRELITYARSLSSLHVSINIYLKETLNLYASLVDKAKKLYDCGVYLDDTEIEEISTMCKGTISGLVYFVWSEFHLDDSAEDVENEVADLRVDECVKIYLDKILIDLKDFVAEVVGIREVFKFKLRVFDEYPELELEFEKIMGVDLYAIDESRLSIEDVLAVLNGSKDPSDLILENIKEQMETNNEIKSMNAFSDEQVQDYMGQLEEE